MKAALRIPPRPWTALAAAAALCGLAAQQDGDADADPDKGPGFERFRAVIQKNIFDPDRRPERPRRATPRPTPRPPAPDILSLTGAILYPGHAFAFFDGAARDYQAALKVGDTIAGFTIARIQANQVTLDRDGEALALNVGDSLRREGDAPWRRQSGRGDFQRPAAPARSNETQTKAQPAAAPAADGRAAILERLRARRAQEGP